VGRIVHRRPWRRCWRRALLAFPRDTTVERLDGPDAARRSEKFYFYCWCRRQVARPPYQRQTQAALVVVVEGGCCV
jgi:hypothetical protein